MKDEVQVLVRTRVEDYDLFFRIKHGLKKKIIRGFIKFVLFTFYKIKNNIFFVF